MANQEIIDFLNRNRPDDDDHDVVQMLIDRTAAVAGNPLEVINFERDRRMTEEERVERMINVASEINDRVIHAYPGQVINIEEIERLTELNGAEEMHPLRVAQYLHGIGSEYPSYMKMHRQFEDSKIPFLINRFGMGKLVASVDVKRLTGMRYRVCAKYMYKTEPRFDLVGYITFIYDGDKTEAQLAGMCELLDMTRLMQYQEDFKIYTQSRRIAAWLSTRSAIPNSKYILYTNFITTRLVILLARIKFRVRAL